MEVHELAGPLEPLASNIWETPLDSRHPFLVNSIGPPCMKEPSQRKPHEEVPECGWVENIGVQKGREPIHALFEPELLIVSGELLQDLPSLLFHLPLVPKDILSSHPAVGADLAVRNLSFVQQLH